MEAVSASALWVAAARAREAARPDRLFTDELSARLAGAEGEQLLETIARQADPVPYIAVRTRFFDELAVSSGLGQVVLVAAGMDTRAFRLPWPRGARVFEVDRAEQLMRKASRLADAVAACERICVAADPTTNWLPALAAAGFSATEPTLWLLEGVVMYFVADGVRALLAAISSVAAPGSRLRVDVIGTAIARPPYQPFGCDDPAALIEPLGWRCTVTQPGEERARFGRWLRPPPPPGVLPAHRAQFVVGER